MAQSLRNLQIFRNDELLTGSVAVVKALINGAFTTGTIVLKDGEPISIRYKEPENGDVKSLFGVAYVNGDDKSILWTPNPSDIVLDTAGDDYVTLNYDVDESGNYILTVGTHTVAIEDAKSAEGETPAVNGLATALDVKTYVTEQIGKINIPTVPEYTIKPLETANDGYLKSYQLFTVIGDVENAVENAVIDIPKDYLVKSATINTVKDTDKAEGGIFYNNVEYEIGDKYFDFVINAKETDGTENHLYINAKALVDTYVAGNGINIADNNTITVKIKEDEQYIAFDENGAIYTTEQLVSDITSKVNEGIQGLGEAKAQAGHVVTGVSVDNNGKLVIQETELSEGEVYYGGHDIKVSTEQRDGDTESKNYIDTSLDAAIESCVTIGNLNNGETLTAGMTLSEILEKILVKEFQPDKSLPSTKLIINPTLKSTYYEVGETLGALTLTHEYTNGYYYADGTNYKTNKFNSLHDVDNNKLPANCTEGETIYKLNDNTISSTYNGTEKLTEGKFTFKCQTSYGASNVTPKTNLGKDATTTITAGSATSNEITKYVYYKAYSVIISNNQIPANISDLMTVSNGYFITSDTVKKTDTYNIQGGESMFLFLPQSKTFTINNSLGSPAQSEFVKKLEVTNTLGTVYNVYQKRNDSDKVAGYKELTFANVQ